MSYSTTIPEAQRPGGISRLAAVVWSSERRWHAIRVVLGLLLLTAAGLKLAGMNVTALPRIGWFSTPRVQVGTVIWELVLGVWLLSGTYRPAAWLAAVGTFLTFAGVSGYLGWSGVANCGCLGVIKASPWLAFGIDATALTLLSIGPPNFGTAIFRLPAGVTRLGLTSLALLAALTGVGSWVYGSPQAAIARLRGHALTVSADYIDFGAGSAGQSLEANVEVRNWTNHPVRLTGGTSDCSCVTTLDLPITIPPGEGRAVVVQLRLPGTGSGAFTRVAEIWTDDSKQRRIHLRLGSRIVD